MLKKGMILAMGLMLAGAGAAFADHGKGGSCENCQCGEGWHKGKGMDGGTHLDKKMERMTQHLDLTADQQAKIKAIKQSKHDKMKALHEDTQKEIRAVLTPEQQKKWEEGKEKRADKMKEKREERMEKKKMKKDKSE